MKMIIETERLYLREFTVNDGQLLVDLNTNPEVIKYLHEATPTYAEAVKIIEEIILPQYQLYNHGRWAVHLQNTHEFIGWCGLKYVKERNEIDLGYRFFQQHWGKGFATEAAKAAIVYGFNQLNLQEIIAMAHVENVGSQNVITKCGMQFYGEDFIDNCPVKRYKLAKQA